MSNGTTFEPLTEPDAADIVTFEMKDEPTEYDLANLLERKVAPALTVGPDWYFYREGRWAKGRRATLRPIAQSILPPKIRTARREHAIVDHLEGRLQKPIEDLASFHRYDGRAVLINCANGVLKVTAETTVLLPHDSSYLFTTQMAARYDPGADSSTFERVTMEAIPDPKDADLLLLCAANLLFPDSRHEVCTVLYGEAGSGKSTIAEGITSALGSDLVRQLSMAQICDSKSYYLPQLQGAAVSIGTELDSLEIADSANFKALVSGEAMEARPIYGEPFTMRSTCKLWFLSNHLPRFKHGTEAELRRMRFIRFDRVPTQKDATLKDTVRAERDGIFLLMVSYLQKLMAMSSIPQGSAKSQETKDRFSITNDPVGSFVKYRCQLKPKAATSKYELAEAYAEFLAEYAMPESLSGSFFKMIYDRYPQLKQVRPRGGDSRIQAVSGIELAQNGHFGQGGQG